MGAAFPFPSKQEEQDMQILSSIRSNLAALKLRVFVGAAMIFDQVRGGSSDTVEDVLESGFHTGGCVGADSFRPLPRVGEHFYPTARLSESAYQPQPDVTSAARPDGVPSVVVTIAGNKYPDLSHSNEVIAENIRKSGRVVAANAFADSIASASETGLVNTVRAGKLQTSPHFTGLAQGGVVVKAKKLPAGKLTTDTAALVFGLTPSTFSNYRSAGKIKLKSTKVEGRVFFDREPTEAAAAKYKAQRDRRVAAGKKKSASAARRRAKG